MATLLRWIESTRLYVLLLSTPYALIWMREPASGGFLIVLAHGLLVLLYFLSLDQARLTHGREPLLGLTRDRERLIPEVVARAHAMTALLVVIVGLVLLFARVWAGVTTLAAAGAILLLVSGAPERSLRWRLRMAELVWPAAALLGPALLIRAFAQRDAERAAAVEGVEGAMAGGMSEGAFAASALGAVMAGAWILCCLIRDEPLDRGEGIRTTPTFFGRAGSIGLFVVWLSGGLLIAALGAGNGWWNWVAPVLLGWAALLSLWALASRREGGAGMVWMAGLGAVGVALASQVGG